ncbi:MAG: hypothetical protein Q8O91_09480 [Candidatus Aminicenantes bacterium]|nr:hypothetical protein [Candidatus Aminicenantes bacterium]
MRKIGALVLAAVLTAAPASAAVSVKLTGGLTYLFENDYNSGVRGAYDFLKDNYESVTGLFRPLSLGGSGAVEVIVPFDDRLGLGFGAGVFQVSVKNRFDYAWWVYTGTESYEPRLTVIPITLNLHYHRPLGNALDVDLFGGAGGYLMRFENKSSSTSDFFAYDREKTFMAQKMVFGLQTGISLEIKVIPHVAVVLQSEARLAKATYIQGDWTEEESWFLGNRREEGQNGIFWFYDKTDVNGTYPQVAFATTQPSDPAFANIRKGTFDLSGLSAAAGIKITF